MKDLLDVIAYFGGLMTGIAWLAAMAFVVIFGLKVWFADRKQRQERKQFKGIVRGFNDAE